MREKNCQHLGSSGGTAAKAMALTSPDNLSVSSANAASNIGSKASAGIVTRAWLDLYCDFSTAQQPLSPQSVLPPGACASTAHWRNSRPETFSNWQCAETGSQRNAASAKNMFLKCRTTDIDAVRTRKVQSNPEKETWRDGFRRHGGKNYEAGRIFSRFRLSENVCSFHPDKKRRGLFSPRRLRFSC